MEVVTVSPKYQVVIPKAVRERMNLRPGQKLEVVADAFGVRLIPELPMRAYRGILRGIDAPSPQDPDREF